MRHACAGHTPPATTGRCSGSANGTARRVARAPRPRVCQSMVLDEGRVLQLLMLACMVVTRWPISQCSAAQERASGIGFRGLGCGQWERNGGAVGRPGRGRRLWYGWAELHCTVHHVGVCWVGSDAGAVHPFAFTDIVTRVFPQGVPTILSTSLLRCYCRRPRITCSFAMIV